jgi:hypothetical protein
MSFPAERRYAARGRESIPKDRALSSSRDALPSRFALAGHDSDDY